MAAHPQARRATRSAGWDAEDHPQSVKTGRTNDEVKAARDAHLERRGAGGDRRDRPVGRRTRRRCRSTSSRCSRRSPRSRSMTDWLFEIKWDGFRVQAVVDDGKVKTGRAASRTPRPTSRRLLTPAELDRGEAGDRRRRGRGPRRGRPARLLPAPDQARRAGRRRARSTRRSTCCISTGGRCSTSRSRIASGCSGACSRSIRGSASRRMSRARARRSSRRRGERARGHDRQAPAAAVRARPALEGLAEAQGPARAGAGDRRLDAGGGQRAGPRRAGRRRTTRTASCDSPARSERGSRARSGAELLRQAQAAGHRRAAVRPAAAQGLQGSLGRRSRWRHLGPARARDARRARRLDARRRRPPGRVQGARAGPRPDDRPSRDRGRTTSAVRAAEAETPTRARVERPAQPCVRAAPRRRSRSRSRSAERSGRSAATAAASDVPAARIRRSSPRSTPSGRRASGASMASSSS